MFLKGKIGAAHECGVSNKLAAAVRNEAICMSGKKVMLQCCRDSFAQSTTSSKKQRVT